MSEYERRERNQARPDLTYVPVLKPLQRRQDQAPLALFEQQRNLKQPEAQVTVPALRSLTPEVARSTVAAQRRTVSPTLRAAELNREDQLAVQRSADQLAVQRQALQQARTTLDHNDLSPEPLHLLERRTPATEAAPLPLTPTDHQERMKAAQQGSVAALNRDAHALPFHKRAELVCHSIEAARKIGLDVEMLRQHVLSTISSEMQRDTLQGVFQRQDMGRLIAAQASEEHGMLLKHAQLQRAVREAQQEHDQLSQSTALERVQARRGQGQSLPEEVRHQLELGLNHDLSAVRVHIDDEADRIAKSLHAVAFTSGKDIYFQTGEYNPASKLELLAHEMTHVKQQDQGKVSPGIDPDASLESEAQQFGEQFVLGGSSSVSPKVKASGKKSKSGGPASTAAVPQLAVQRLAGPTPPSWAASKADPAYIQKLINTDLVTLLRGLQNSLMIDQSYYAGLHLSHPEQLPQAGKVFLDALDHLPVSAALKAKVLVSAAETTILPDMIRSDVIRAALLARRLDQTKGKALLLALSHKAPEGHEITDFGAAVLSRAWDSVVGLLGAVKFVAWDTTQLRAELDPVGYGQTITLTRQTLQAVREHPGLLWDALTADTRAAWKAGKYGTALGYLTFDLGTLALGAPAAVRGATVAGTRVGGAASKLAQASRVRFMVLKTQAGELTAQVVSVSDDLARAAGAGLQGPRLAGTAASTGAARATQGRLDGLTTPGRNVLKSQAAALPTSSPVSRALEAAMKAGNWAAIKNLLGKKPPARLPDDYFFRNGQSQIVRKVADDGKTVALTVDEKGLVQVADPSVSDRISNAATMNNNFKASMGRTPREGYQLHHLLPDNVVRADALTQEAMRRGIYSLDDAANLVEMPGAARGAAPDIHGHFGSHPQYDKLVTKRLEDLRRALEDQYGAIDRIPDKVLLKELRSQESELKTLIQNMDESLPTRIDKESGTKVLSSTEDVNRGNA